MTSLATISVVAVGAVDVLSTAPSSHSSPGYAGHWSVPHDQTNAPVVPTSGGASGGSGSFNAVSCPSASECVAVGADAGLGGVASTSNDGGGNWRQGAMALGEPQLNAVNCSSTMMCVAVGQGASVRSTDGGMTWSSHSIPTNNTTLLGVKCPSPSTCVSVGVAPGNNGPYVGRLLVSSDGGITWKVPALPASVGALGSVDCPTSTFCVAVGASILVSNDRAKSWSARAVSGGTGVLRSVACQSASNCVAIGPNPAGAQDANAAAYEVVTTDGGATWSSVALPPGSATLDVVSCSSGVSCQSAGSSLSGGPAPILTSTDGGGSWTADQSLPGSVTAVSAMSCGSTTNCVFVGESGKKPVTVTSANGVASGESPVSSLVRTQKDVSR